VRLFPELNTNTKRSAPLSMSCRSAARMDLGHGPDRQFLISNHEQILEDRLRDIRSLLREVIAVLVDPNPASWKPNSPGRSTHQSLLVGCHSGLRDEV